MVLPNKKQTIKILKEIEEKEKKGEIVGAEMLPKDASALEQMKYKICRNILLTKREYDLTHEQIGKLIGVDRHRVSMIVNYHIDRFSFDSLMLYYQMLIESTEDGKAIKAFDKEVKNFLEVKELKYG